MCKSSSSESFFLAQNLRSYIKKNRVVIKRKATKSHSFIYITLDIWYILNYLTFGWVFGENGHGFNTFIPSFLVCDVLSFQR